MARQIVHLPATTIATIINHASFPKSHAFGIRAMELVAAVAPDSPLLRVHVDPLIHCPEQRSHFIDDVYALLITSNPGDASVGAPQSLPELMVLFLLDQAKGALAELPDLNGHDRMEIESAFEEAMNAEPIAREGRRRPPASTAESALVSDARRLQGELGPALRRLDRKLTRHQAGLQASGLEAAVVRLGLQAQLGIFLRLDPAGPKFTPSLAAPWRNEIGGLWRAPSNRLNAFQDMIELIHRGAVDNRNWLQVDQLASLHATLMKDLPGSERAGRLRVSEMRIRCPFDGRMTTIAVPKSGVAEALQALVTSYDAALWRDAHPLIRAAAAHIAIVKLHPYSDGNGRMARLLLHGLLLESGIPALPLEAILAWNRAAYLSYVERAVTKGELLAFVQYLIKACEQAILLARRMIAVLRPERDKIRTVFLSLGSSRRLAIKAAEFTCSMILGPDPQCIRRTLNGVELSWYLSDSRLFDVVDAAPLGLTLSGYDTIDAYSASAARAFMAAPPARM